MFIFDSQYFYGKIPKTNCRFAENNFSLDQKLENLIQLVNSNRLFQENGMPQFV